MIRRPFSTTDGMQLRLGTPADLAFLQACARAAYAEYVPLIGREPAPMTADYAAELGRESVLVAVLADRPVGFAVAFEKAGAWFLETVAVLPDEQGKGLGSRLVAAVEADAVARGFDRLVLYTNAAMAGPLRLYPRLGYRQTGVVEEDGFRRVYFEKRLESGAGEV